MKNFRIGLSVILLFLPALVFAGGGLRVSGNVSGNWEADTVYVDGDITVQAGESLNIAPGTRVYFTGQYEFTVYGQLTARGTETDTIFFFADSLGRDHGSQSFVPLGFWWGIQFKNTDVNGSPASALEYCDFRYAMTRGLDGSEPNEDADSLGAPLKFYYSSNVSLKNISIRDCNAYIYGNIHLVHSSIEMSELYFDESTGSYSAIEFRAGSDASLKNCVFDYKPIYISNSSPVLDSLIFENINTTPLRASGFGGTVKNTVFRNNVYSWSGGGGAVYLEGGSTAEFERVLFSGNRADYADGWYGMGGAVYISSSSPAFTNCEFIGNMAYGSGSAIYIGANDSQWVTSLDNCLIVKNYSVMGGGAIVTASSSGINMTNCTVANNTAQYQAAILNDVGADNIITNSIIYWNGPDYDNQMSMHQSDHILTYNIIQGDYYGKDTSTTNLHDVDPLFRDTSAVDFHLQSTACGYSGDSPAIDAGAPEIGDYALDCTSGGLGSSRSDMGAYGGAHNHWDEAVALACHYAGDVSGTWDCDRIYIDGDITVPAGDTLEITRNVEWVLISGPYQIKVEGTLLARGPENEHVSLGGDYIKFQGSGWHGIFFNNLNDAGAGTSVIENCRFDYADKRDMTYQGGGAIAIYNSDNVIVRNSVFYKNNAYLGGAVYIEDSDPVIENCYFEINGRGATNDTEPAVEGGGAMYIKNSNPYLHKLQFMNNSAHGGGAMVLDNSSPVISNVLMAGNVSSGIAGGIHCINGASPKIVNLSAVENTAVTAGGAFYLNSNSHLEIINSILYDGSKPEIYLDGGSVSAVYSIVDGAADESWFGEGCLDTNPFFVAGVEYRLANNNCDYSGGSDAVSPAIDAGHPDSLDQRLSCDAGLGTSRADMGFYGGRYAEPVTAVAGDRGCAEPEKYALYANYPNPFNPVTTIRFSLPRAGNLTVEIFNALGQKIAVLYKGRHAAGEGSVVWNAAGYSSGLYFVRMTAGRYTRVRKMVLMK